jgi:hypothetical protein
MEKYGMKGIMDAIPTTVLILVSAEKLKNMRDARKKSARRVASSHLSQRRR